MNRLNNGQYFGCHYQKLNFDGFIISDTEYTHEKVDWHYHENPYFTFLLQGKLFEENKRDSYYLAPGSLLFHNWQDAHHNIKPKEYTRGFHVELNPSWFEKYDTDPTDFEGSFQLHNPQIKRLLGNIFIEMKTNDSLSEESIGLSILNVFDLMVIDNGNSKPISVHWIPELREILKESDSYNCSIKQISNELGIHPGHLSRVFHKYFGTSFGKYIRQQKTNKAFHLILGNKLTMAEISYDCGFYDQSHFISTFKNIYGFTPYRLSKIISQG